MKSKIIAEAKFDLNTVFMYRNVKGKYSVNTIDRDATLLCLSGPNIDITEATKVFAYYVKRFELQERA